MTVSGETFRIAAVSSIVRPAKESQFDDAALALVERGERIQRVVERHEVLARLVRDNQRLVDGHLRAAAAFLIVARAPIPFSPLQ
jgi:hypothetical protein